MIKKFTQYYIKIASIVFFAGFSVFQLIPEKSFATHSMGADLTYSCLSGNTYLFRFSFYRDCNGIPAPFNVNVDVHSTSCNIDTVAHLHPIPGTGQDITPICPYDTTTCHGGHFTGIQEWIYEGTFTFPAQCTDWQLTYELCCRNGAITNINTPLSEEIMIYANLNNTICDNSPTFSNKPVPFVCQGQQFCFNHGAFDADGDSLAYTLIDPLSYNANPVQYVFPYSASQPLNSIPPMTFDGVTGDFCITPQSLEVTVMAVLVSEYRNGVLIGQVERDIQITVIPCTNQLPNLTGINGTNSFSATICADAPYCFDVFSNDPDIGQNVTVTWDHAIPAATFNSSVSPHPTGTFCWTPTQADAGGTPHCFTATVTDDACPFLGSQVYAYCFTVVNVTVDAGPDQSVSCTSLATINASGTTTSGNVTYQWDNGALTQSQNVGPGTYVVTAQNGQCSATDTVNILPVSGPIALYSAPPVCDPSPVTFTDNSYVTGGSSIISWHWDFGDGAVSTLTSPVHQYSTPGTYNTCLIVVTNLNCADTVCQSVTINAPPTASFTAYNACAGSAISMTNNSNPLGSLSYSWDFGNGITSTATSPAVTYTTGNNYNISMIATDAIGCSDTAYFPVTAYPVPDAGFTYQILNPCPGNQFTFNDTTSVAIASWSWNLGNGQTSNLHNPSATYNTGTYNVSLIVTSQNGCIDTTDQNISINPPFVASIGPPDSICNGNTATLQAFGGVSYSWSSGQSTDVIHVTPGITTNYIVTVTDTNGCTDTAQVSVLVYSLPQVNAGPDVSICTGSSTNLLATGASSYLWSTGDITSGISVGPSSQTTYSVTGTDQNGCINSDTVVVTINPQLLVNPLDTFICPGGIATLDAGNPGSQYLWSGGETTQTISTNIQGTYSVQVTDVNGCSGTGQATVTVGGGSLTDNTGTFTACNGLYVTLDAGNPGNAYLWSTGATTQTISLNTAGNYNVLVTDNDGCTISFPQSIYLNPLPVTSFSTSPVCAYDSTNFQNTSVVSSGSIVNYQWDFGDGSYSTDINPVHFYGTNNTFNTSLVATTDSGCTASYSAQVNILPVPVAAFQDPDVCEGAATIFTDLSQAINSSISSWQWDFGDGSTSTVQGPTHQYGNAITYPVQLIVITNDGCVDTVSGTAVINPQPVANAGNDASVCSGDIILVGTASLSGVTYQWNPVTNLDQPWSSETNFHGTNNSGNPDVTDYILTATNQFGCIDADTVTLTILPVPLVVFNSPPPQCFPGNSFSFDPHGTINVNTLMNWTFGSTANPGTSISSTPSGIVYSAPGTYPVVLNYSYAGCPGSTVIDSVTIWPVPETGFTPSANEGCMPLTVSFDNTHPVNTSQYSWLIEGQTFHNVDPVYTFNHAGSFVVTLEVTDIHGCVAPRYTAPVDVYPYPEADFTFSPERGRIYESLIEFTNKSYGGTFYEWNFGDGTIETFFDGNHIYGDTGSFDISLIVTTDHGCRDTAFGRIIIEDGFSFYVPNAFTPNDDRDNDFFQGYGTYISSYEMWIYNRWGLLIYHTNDYDRPWDGRNNSNMCQNDTYVYRIRVTDYREKEHIFIGSVTLVK